MIGIPILEELRILEYSSGLESRGRSRLCFSCSGVNPLTLKEWLWTLLSLVDSWSQRGQDGSGWILIKTLSKVQGVPEFTSSYLKINLIAISLATLILHPVVGPVTLMSFTPNFDWFSMHLQVSCVALNGVISWHFRSLQNMTFFCCCALPVLPAWSVLLLRSFSRQAVTLGHHMPGIPPGAGADDRAGFYFCVWDL